MSELSRYQDTPIGPYRLTRLIGVGPVSRVYLGKRADWPANPVALKLFETVPIHDPEEQDAILDEARLLACMEHPAVLPILDDGLHEKMLYLVTPYIEASSLRQRLTSAAGEPLPIAEALMIIQQVGEALQFAHSQQIVHANLKPENILFQNDEQILLGDFLLPGLVKSERAARILSSFAALYMAPEQFRGIATPLSDQYALACLAYELLTGRPPFEADDGMSLARQHATREPEPPSHVQPLCTPQTDLALLKALVKRPEGRYPDIRTFLAELKLAPAPVELSTRPEVAPAAAPPPVAVPTALAKAAPPALLPLEPAKSEVSDLETVKQPVPQGIAIAVKTGIHEAVMMARRGIRARSQTSAQPQLAPALVPTSRMLVPLQAQQTTRRSRRQVWLVTAITLLVLLVSISGITLFFNAAAARQNTPQPRVDVRQTATAPVSTTSSTQVVPTVTATGGQATATAAATPATTPKPTATPTSQPTPTPTATATPTPSPTPAPPAVQCRVSYRVTSQWPGGFLANVTITNTGSTSIQDWRLTFTFPGTQHIINGWGGNFTQSGSQVSATGSSFSSDLSAGESTSLGFQASVQGANNTPASFSLNGVACA